MTPNEVTYTILNNGYCKGGKVVIYLALVENMKENGCEPNIHTDKLLMNGFHKENDLIQIRRPSGVDLYVTSFRINHFQLGMMVKGILKNK